MAKSPVYTKSKAQRQNKVKQGDCQTGCPLFIKLTPELLPITKTDHSRQLLTDKCSKWLKNRSDFSKQGNSRVKTEGPPVFYTQQAAQSKSEGINSKSRGLLLTTTAPSKPCFICGSMDWWLRPPSSLGGPGEWLCGVCHPEPNYNRTGASQVHGETQVVGAGIITKPQGGPGGWLYSICHPNPEKKTVNGVGPKHQLPDASPSTPPETAFFKVA